MITAAPDTSVPRSRQCRCLPSQPCWPTSGSWSAFNDTVGGRLISTTPPAYECHDPHYDSVKCQEIQKGYFFDHWRQHQPGASQQPLWEVFGDKGCLGFNRTTHCYQGAVPLYTVNATSIEDVQATIRFATENNVRLVVKNTGHDYLGRSIGASSLSLWLYYMKGITFSESFVPEGATDGSTGSSAIVLGAGVLWIDVYRAAEDHNVIVVGGAEGTVGATGGFCQAGGHSPLSPRHGLCVDNVLQYKVVTADGKLKIANAYQNTDLFWALRGGGGGTFGVVVEAIYKTHPPVKNINYVAYRLYFNGSETVQKIAANFFSHQAAWSDAGWSGYSYILNNFMAFLYYLPDADISTANSSISPFFNYVDSLGNVKVEGTLTSYPSFWKNFEATLPSLNDTNAGDNTILGSRLIPRSSFESATGTIDLANAIVNIQEDLQDYGNPRGAIITHLVAGGSVSKGTSVETSVLPAWRKALMHLVLMSSWADDTPIAVQHLFARKLTAATQRLRDLTPGSGAYFNEADPNEPNWQTTFFGHNYARLKAIKNKVDPKGLFICRNCVGSENWNGILDNEIWSSSSLSQEQCQGILNLQSLPTIQLCTMKKRIAMVPNHRIPLDKEDASVANLAHIRISYLDGLTVIATKFKSSLAPVETIQHLGFEINTSSLTLKIPGSKIRDMRREAAKLIYRGTCAVRQLSSFIGKAIAMTAAVFPAHLRVQQLMAVKIQASK
ncbi:hypothetical protein EDD11_005927 [Mortierella claussenii]|nr:hypothetical protein EDD11_005927 [Mortierella claussenii]